MSPLVTAALASTASILVDVVWRVGNIITEPISTNIIPVTSEKWACDIVSISYGPTVQVIALTFSVHKQLNHFWKPVINLDKVSEEHFAFMIRFEIWENMFEIG